MPFMYMYKDRVYFNCRPIEGGGEYLDKLYKYSYNSNDVWGGWFEIYNHITKEWTDLINNNLLPEPMKMYLLMES